MQRVIDSVDLKDLVPWYRALWGHIRVQERIRESGQVHGAGFAHGGDH